jgi:hypothetical protein
MSSKTIGLAAASAAVNHKFFVITEGLLAGLNTSAANVGDAVWLGVDGALIFGLTNKPVAPAHLVYIGVVTRKNANNGEIFVHIQNGFELNEIHDVLINGVATGNLIRRDSDGLWKNWAPNFITANSVDTLLNKTIPLGTGIYEIFPIDDISGFAGQTDIPIYQDGIDKGGRISIDEELVISVSNSGIGYYTGAVTTSGGTRFSISVNGNTLTGTLAEFNVALTDGSFATESYVDTQIEYIDNIGDVNLVSPVAADVLTFDGTEWVNAPIQSTDKHYSHNQNSASATWTITHNLGKNPSISVVDSAGTGVIGQVSYVSLNQLIVYFTEPFSGKVYLN